MSDEKKLGLDSLEVWQTALTFAVEICRNLLPGLPIEEKYSLSPQIRRAVQSIPANIAEGYGRYYYQEGIRYFYISRGSLEEVYSQITMAFHLRYITENQYGRFNSQIKEIRKLINGYILYLRNSKRGANEPGGSSQIRELQSDEEPLYQSQSFDSEEF